MQHMALGGSGMVVVVVLGVTVAGKDARCFEALQYMDHANGVLE